MAMAMARPMISSRTTLTTLKVSVMRIASQNSGFPSASE
jgi:hypothetical protein